MDKFKKAQQQLHASHGTEHDWNLLQTCISLLEHIGDFRLKLIDFEKNLVQCIHKKQKEIDDAYADASYLCSNYKLSSKSELNEFQKLFDKTHERFGVFSSIFDAITPICEYIHDTILAAIFTPIENQFNGAHFDSDENIELSSSNDLPDYSIAPQEFITVIGQVSEITQYFMKYQENVVVFFFFFPLVFIDTATTFGTITVNSKSTIKIGVGAL